MKRRAQLLFVAVLLPLLAWFGLYGESLSLDVLKGLFTPMEIRDGVKVEQFKTPKVANNDERPLFLLHVGPSKTGTTTIQWFAGQNKELLQENNIYYLGPAGKGSYNVHELRYDCRAQMDDNCAARWKDFGELVEFHYKLNHNVMISEEKFACKFLDAEDEQEHMWKYLTPLLKKWRVRVLFSYRRFYEWIPSKYYQAFNPDSAGPYGIEKKENWPGSKGRPIPSFPEYFDDFIYRKNFKHPAQLKKRWEERFPDVWIYNFHGGGEFLETFFCQMLPEGTKLCEFLKSQPTDVTKNPSASKSLHFDMLAVGAYKRNWVDDGLARPNVTKAVEAYSKSLGYSSMMDFPLECLSDYQIATLLNHSLALEEDLTPNFFLSSNGQPELESRFEVAKEKKKFCSIDVDEVLKDKRWQQFFRSLGSTQGGKQSQSNGMSLAVGKNRLSTESLPEEGLGPGEPNQKKRHESILCIFNGDEGSSAMSEALGRHPEIYSPEWSREPVDRRFWKKKEYALKPLLQAIRFLLRMPTSDTNFNVGRKNPISQSKYSNMVGDAKATYLKARLCSTTRSDPEAWRACLKEALGNLMCGDPEETLDHLILPIRYGFDRVCSKFVHHHKDLYQQVAQFSGTSDVESKHLSAQMSPEEAEMMEKEQEMYIDNFIDLVEIARESCPGQQHKTKIHVFDYDTAKNIGMEEAMRGLVEDLGFHVDAQGIDFGTFSDRKPGNYCETILDKKSHKAIVKQESVYTSWLQDTCNRAPTSPWCGDGNKQISAPVERSVLPSKRPKSMLCIFNGDEGSTAMTEALALHPQVYSPSFGGHEPVDRRFWSPEDFKLQPMLQAIRFLLRMPSSDANFTVGRKKPIPEKKYSKMVGDADATYIKARVCQTSRGDPEEWRTCLREALDNLMCGDPEDVLDHLILPIRYGFDRACSKFVHRHKELYSQVAQFSGTSDVESKHMVATMSPEEAQILEKDQERYIDNFIDLVRIARESCPGQERRTQIHIFDYDAAKEVGMEKALRSLVESLGLHHDAQDVDLGRFGERKPGNYCETLLDKASHKEIMRQENTYQSWLQGTCKKTPGSPWCIQGESVQLLE